MIRLPRWRSRSAGHALGTRGVTVIAFRDGVEPQAPRYSEVFAAAERPGIPVWIHTGHHLCTRRPNELPHPRAIDVIAGRHLDLRTVAGHEVADLGLGDAVTHDWLREMRPGCWDLTITSRTHRALHPDPPERQPEAL